jgi:hypothetical protein
MLIEIPFPSFNPRRYGRPWGACITFDGAKPVYDFCGHWDGSSVVIEAAADAVICYGQRDNRGKGTMKQFAVVDAEGRITDVTESAARKHALATPSRA